MPTIEPIEPPRVARWRRRGGEPTGGHGSEDLVSRVLVARGLVPGTPGARAFLDPKLDQLHDPSLIPDLDAAADRLLLALERDEPIGIFGDYDVDGLTATAILTRMLRSLNPNAALHTHIPHRLTEGYGLNVPALRALCGRGCGVVVTVDCGVTAREEAVAARDLGLDLIITDHHNPPSSLDRLPDAFGVVHPGRPDSRYPFAGLCGAGVAFKLAWRLATRSCGSERVTPELRRQLLDLLGLAAMGTIADVVPLVDENRAICRQGIPRLGQGEFVGVRELLRVAGRDDKPIDAGTVGFALAPRLNASGRMGDATPSLDLLLTTDPDRAASIARQLNIANETRRDIERRITSEANALADDRGMTGDDRRGIVLASADWHPGVVGIVCSRLVEQHHRPVILGCLRDGEVVASGRSVPGVSLHDLLERCRDALTRFGGHDMACGLRTTPDRFESFADRFTEECNARVAKDELTREVEYDCDATVDELSADTVERLEEMSPFGRENPRVRLRLNGVTVTTQPAPLGQHGKHAALHVGTDDGSIRVLGWNKADRLLTLSRGQTIDLVVCPKVSTWQGRRRVEAELEDLAPGAGAGSDGRSSV